MIRTQISVDAKTYRAAQVEARRLGISLAELCRRALAKMLGDVGTVKAKPWMRYSGSIRGRGERDSENENIDRVVYGSRK